MKSRTTPFIFAVLGGASAVLIWLPPLSVSTASKEFIAIAVLAGLALVAEMLSFILPKGAQASVASIPMLAAVLVSPTFETVCAIAIVKALVVSARRMEFEKAVFNVAQFALSFGVAALAYVAFGGEPFIALRNQSISSISAINGLPFITAFLAFFATNSLLVNLAIAISTGSRLSSVWRANHLATIGMDIVASPLIFLFAWAYVQFGPIAAVALWIPIIGIRQVHSANLELERTNVELLDLMVKSIEARDPYTSGHSRRVQDYSMMIARALGLSEKEIQMVGRAALLHDVGKIHEKYGPILRKADRLSPEEWTTMRGHPADGAALIATMTRLRELVAPVRHHHENWDGTGYPDGLAGELIPQAARIIRFADTIDAMTTERPYRRIMDADEVRGEIVRCRGTQFDPQIVDQLLSSPVWRTMLAPDSSVNSRFGSLAMLPRGDGRSAKSVGA
jgi:putative nucleotidyltransferase with HDIG domain